MHFGDKFLFNTFLNELLFLFSFFKSNNVYSESCRLNLGNVNLTTKVKDSEHRLKQVYLLYKNMEILFLLEF